MRKGERKLLPYEAPQNRRVNVAGAYAPYGSSPRLAFETRRKEQGRYDAEAHLAFVRGKVAGLPADPPPGYVRERPCVIVLDNYSVHKSRTVKDQVPVLEAQGVRFFFLPSYSPELNLIEPVWRQVKYQEIPERSHTSSESLQTAVEAALNRKAKALTESTTFSNPLT